MRTLSIVLVPGFGNLEIKISKTFKIWGTPRVTHSSKKRTRRRRRGRRRRRLRRRRRVAASVVVATVVVGEVVRVARGSADGSDPPHVRGNLTVVYVRVGGWALPITRSRRSSQS